MSYSLRIRHVHCCLNEKKKLSNEVTILLHLYSYTCVVIFCQRNLHDSQDHGSYLEWIEVPPPSTKSTLPLNFVETVCFRHALILMHG